MDWDGLRHFAALAEEGSLSAAARRLGVEHATVARRVAALEAQLGLRLVDRRGRRLVLTPEGARIAILAARMEREAQAIGRAAAGTRSSLVGEVTLSAPPALAAARLMAPLAALQARHPGLTIRLRAETRHASLARREAEVAVRLSRPETGEVAVSRLGEMTFRLYANPDSLRGRPEAAWRFVGADGAMQGSPQQVALEAVAAGRPFAVRAESVEIQAAAARAGAGIAMLPDFLAAADPLLAPLRPQDPPLRREIWLVVHADLRAAPAVRAVTACLRDAFAGPPPAPEG
ncbi:transcriptional regulator, LysR family [Methylobacterium sp. 4-46]|uniref:LysR family transcriptional regulator n=1 Tax=unclassified Methylobacterium TaxID=2615210 RepID=UPI000152D88C|nr:MULTISPECIES: LysR family transcriptional regulator [Methylobacterium]ACA20461.1 transcriptional regulator, LysR family [Methylobacterium sp. 4-46]WFT79629.1 LysR family transcriptional regulator [Methylobacterium nodulans]